MFALHPSLQRAFVAYGSGAILAGVATLAMNLGDAWYLLGNGGESFIAAGVLRLVLGVGTLAVVFGAALLRDSSRRTKPTHPSTQVNRFLQTNPYLEDDC